MSWSCYEHCEQLPDYWIIVFGLIQVKLWYSSFMEVMILLLHLMKIKNEYGSNAQTFRKNSLRTTKKARERVIRSVVPNTFTMYPKQSSELRAYLLGTWHTMLEIIVSLTVCLLFFLYWHWSIFWKSLHIFSKECNNIFFSFQ